MSRRHRHKREQKDVELNLAAMLDMAFQLLTFFILTFKPSPIEGEIAMHLPPPVSTTNVAMQSATSEGGGAIVKKDFTTLPILVRADSAGRMASVAIGASVVFTGEATREKLGVFDLRLRDVFAIAGTPYDQVLVQVAEDLHYEELMKVVEACSRQTLPDGTKLSKISFSELPSGSSK